jgi:poly(A) polymerase Pap1
VHSPGTDIDAILVFRSKYVSQKDFLQSFVKHVQNQGDFYDLLSISMAKVPIIKVNHGQLEFDILFACVDEPKGILKFLK